MINFTKILFCALMFLFSNQLISQNQSWNMIEVGSFDPVSEDYNDVWGFEQGGNQYAVIGSVNGIFVVDVTDCTNPSQVGSFNPTGSSSIWRDFKTYNGYIYGVCDNCDEGLAIIDASGLPSTAPSLVYESTAFFEEAHNIYIDGNYLYAVGTDTQREGIIILDISTPSSPTLVTSVNLDVLVHTMPTGTDYYIHDINVSGGIAYCSHGYSFFATWDISNPFDISLIDTYSTGNYAHSSWNNGNAVYVCSELPSGQPVVVLNKDASGGNLSFVSSFQHPIETIEPGCPANRPHNPFVKGDTLYISYYHDGVHLYDVSSPNSPQHIGYYDTFPDNDGLTGTSPCNYNTFSGFGGAWGVYPFLSNDCILASDDTYGLRILRFSETVPVSWKSFDVRKKDEAAELMWATASEVNNDYFDIERSSDGLDFESIGILSGAGTFENESNYSFTDHNPLTGKSYYRIKQVDFDGSFDYSDILVLRKSDINELKVYPNPTQGIVNLSLPEADMNIEIWDVQGKKVGEYFSSAKDIQLDLSMLRKGYYQIKVQKDYYQELTPLIIVD